MSKWLTIALCVLGLALAVYVVSTNNRKIPDAPPAATPTVNPFPDGIAASGTIEAASRNLAINAPEGGLVMEVLAGVNDHVEKGQALFRLDDRPLRAQLSRLQAAQVQAEAELARLRAMPRTEDLPPMQAGVERARTRLADAQDWYEALRAAREDEAASAKELNRARFALDTVRAELDLAKAQLALLQAGTWDLDLQVATARVALAAAEVQATRDLIERLTVKSPIAGVVLKRAIEPGRFATTDPLDPALVVGDLNELHVRAQVDEEDLPRLRDGAQGVARLRGAADHRLPLVMLRIEPLAIPKLSLTGSVTERVDTRVVEVVFRIESLEGTRVFPGQVVDVYIAAGPTGP